MPEVTDPLGMLKAALDAVCATNPARLANSEAITELYRQLARAEADSFVKRVGQYHQLRRKNPDVLATIWWDEMGKLLRRMKENGRIDLLDNHLGPDGLDITIMGPQAKKK